MLYFNQITLGNIVVHRVGSTFQEDGINFSHKYLKLENDFVTQIMLKYFLTPFKSAKYNHFKDEVSLEHNKVCQSVAQIFDDTSMLFVNSIEIAKHLYEMSNYPKIKAGELYIVYMADVLFDDEMVDAIGIFKTENKDTFLQVNRVEDDFEVKCDDGININKLDKGCIILNTERENGFIAVLPDGHNKNDTAYWIDDFLKLKPRKDSYHQTKQSLEMCKQFIDVFSNENELNSIDAADLKNKTLKYFTENDSFSTEEFGAEVLGIANQHFEEYKKTYESENNVEIPDEFEIAEKVVSSQKKFFKAVLKLDKNFHVYVHGDRELIEKGYDENFEDGKGKSFYKLYYDNEE